MPCLFQILEMRKTRFARSKKETTVFLWSHMLPFRSVTDIGISVDFRILGVDVCQTSFCRCWGLMYRNTVVRELVGHITSGHVTLPDKILSLRAEQANFLRGSRGIYAKAWMTDWIRARMRAHAQQQNTSLITPRGRTHTGTIRVFTGQNQSYLPPASASRGHVQTVSEGSGENGMGSPQT